MVAPGGLGRPSSVTVPSRLAEAGPVAGMVTVWSVPALALGAWLVGGAPPLVYSMWSKGAKVPSKASAVRRPVPVIWTARALPWTQPGRLTIAWTRAAMSGVCCAAVLALTVDHAGGFQGTEAVVRARLLRLLLVAR